MRIRRIARNAYAIGASNCRAQRQPVDWRTLLLQLLGLVVVDGQRERDLAGGDQLRQQRMPLAHRHAVGGDDVLEQLDAARFTELRSHAGQPVLVVGFDA